MIIQFLLFLSWCNTVASTYLGPPGELRGFHYKRWGEHVVAAHLSNMTYELCLDAKLKLDQADMVQARYTRTLSYDLGSVAAGLQDTFEHMLLLYKKYSNMTEFQLETMDKEDMLIAYNIIQGDYNQIRLEKRLFDDVKREHLSNRKKKTTLDPLENFEQYKNRPHGRRMEYTPAPRSGANDGIPDGNENNVANVVPNNNGMVNVDLAGGRIKTDDGALVNELALSEELEIKKRLGLRKYNDDRVDYGLPVPVTLLVTKKKLWRPKL